AEAQFCPHPAASARLDFPGGGHQRARCRGATGDGRVAGGRTSVGGGRCRRPARIVRQILRARAACGGDSCLRDLSLPLWRCRHRSNGASPPRPIRSRAPPRRTDGGPASGTCSADRQAASPTATPATWPATTTIATAKTWRSEEHTSELQSLAYL